MPAATPRSIALAAAVAVTLGAGAFAATSASAAEVPLSGYELTWGIKQSYRTYAAGTFTPAGGASQAADNGAFTFVQGAGSYDAEAHTVSLGFQGSLNIASTLHGFDITLSDVQFDSKDAELTADVTKSGTTTQDVPLAKVTVTREMKDMATTLTKEAADALGSASYEGAAGDPLTVTAPTPPSSPPPSTPETTPPATTTPTPTDPASTPASPTPTATDTTTPSPTATESEPATEGDILDGKLGWGVKESFRTYVVGGVANGKITASDGATRATGNGAFTFPDATGSYDNDADTLSAAFEGAVNFKGHETNGTYALDLTLSGLEVALDGGKGELTADVTSLGKKTDDVVLADLKTNDATLTPEDDVITVSDITAALTEAGAKAFSGYYTSGTELDPVTLSVALSDDATLPSDGGSSGTGDSSGGSGSTGGSGTTGGTTGSTTGGISGGLAATGSDIPVTALGTAAAVTVAAGAGVVFAMRRRRNEA
ncbi:HtaA domain-containing protein [Streptomyces pseudovenezuelae]|uniref:Htaa domain-containing protein n=1 Tax=Streptomyces pseudovenezuelae TaxID=67350 RepID=A0ABT6LJU7_9ACTN|nr:HtaA domain-containing protein [Streptomyces pseudovenezuelae]MDH6216576.1 hypothetical protein [Streptomyces pseudovenezuelae]